MPLLPPEQLQAVTILLLVALLLVLCLCVLPLYVLRDRELLARISSGRAGLLVNVICCMPVLCYNSSHAYLMPCVRAYLSALCDAVVCAPLRAVCCVWCCTFKDAKFPPNQSSIGACKSDGEAEWVRAPALLGGTVSATRAEGRVRVSLGPRAPRVKLFEGAIEPRDVAQGGVGNCWLVAVGDRRPK